MEIMQTQQAPIDVENAKPLIANMLSNQQSGG